MKKDSLFKYCFGVVAALMFSILFLQAQRNVDSSSEKGLTSMVKATAGYNNGLEWELRIGRKSTIALFGGIGIGTQTDNFLDYRARFIISPEAYTEYRNYYNLLKRINKQKRTANNSANFLFGRIETIFQVKNQNYFGLLIIEGWGLQRTLYKKLSLGCHLGIAEHFYYDKPPDGSFNYLKLEPTVELFVSYRF